MAPGPTSSRGLIPSLPCKTHPAVLGDLCTHPRFSGGFSQHTALLQEALLVPLLPSRNQRPQMDASVASAEVNSPQWPIPRRTPLFGSAPCLGPKPQAPGDLGPWGVGCCEAPLVWTSRDILVSPQAGPWKLEKRGSLLLGVHWSLGRLAACVLGSLGPCVPGREEAGWAGLGVSRTSWARGSL